MSRNDQSVIGSRLMCSTRPMMAVIKPKTGALQPVRPGKDSPDAGSSSKRRAVVSVIEGHHQAGHNASSHLRRQPHLRSRGMHRLVTEPVYGRCQGEVRYVRGRPSVASQLPRPTNLETMSVHRHRVCEGLCACTGSAWLRSSAATGTQSKGHPGRNLRSCAVSGHKTRCTGWPQLP